MDVPQARHISIPQNIDHSGAFQHPKESTSKGQIAGVASCADFSFTQIILSGYIISFLFP